MRRKHRKEFTELAQSYRWKIERLESRVRDLERELQENSVARVRFSRDPFRREVMIRFELLDPRVTSEQAMAERVAHQIVRGLLELPDYRAYLREHDATGRDFTLK